MLLLLISRGYIPKMDTREICSITCSLPWQADFFIFPAQWGFLNLQSQTQELPKGLKSKVEEDSPDLVHRDQSWLPWHNRAQSVLKQYMSKLHLQSGEKIPLIYEYVKDRMLHCRRKSIMKSRFLTVEGKKSTAPVSTLLSIVPLE